jgi:hypothetical protein
MMVKLKLSSLELIQLSFQVIINNIEDSKCLVDYILL